MTPTEIALTVFVTVTFILSLVSIVLLYTGQPKTNKDHIQELQSKNEETAKGFDLISNELKTLDDSTNTLEESEKTMSEWRVLPQYFYDTTVETVDVPTEVYINKTVPYIVSLCEWAKNQGYANFAYTNDADLEQYKSVYASKVADVALENQNNKNFSMYQLVSKL